MYGHDRTHGDHLLDELHPAGVILVAPELVLEYTYLLLEVTLILGKLFLNSSKSSQCSFCN